MKRPTVLFSCLLCCFSTGFPLSAGTALARQDTELPGKNFANGIKIGDVTSESAIVWVRLTQYPDRNKTGIAFPDVGVLRPEKMNKSTEELTGGFRLSEMEGGVPGTEGWVRILFWPETAPDLQCVTNWRQAVEASDYTCQFSLTGLMSGTRYCLRVDARPGEAGLPACTVDGRFGTAPAAHEPAAVRFAVVTCQDYPRRDDLENGHIIYKTMLSLNPDFFVHTGDIEYYDKPLPYAPNLELARFKWNRIFALPFQRNFFLNMASYFMKDDHDLLRNDCWPGQVYGDLTWEQGLAVFREQVPLGDKPYRTFRWGKDLQIWLVEGREFRSPNTMPDGPGKTIWGKEQIDWFMRTVQDSDATFRIVITPTPMVGPDREDKNDNYANAGFSHEGSRLRRFIADQANMIVITGDRHWQYHSIDAETGLHEFGTGPASDMHASGWKQDDFRPEHRYLNLKGGFLYGSIERAEKDCILTLQHRSVDGDIYYEAAFHTALK